MALTRLLSVSLFGIDAIPIEIESDVVQGGDKTSFILVGLPDAAVKESKDRVTAAIRNSGFPHPFMYCTVNMAPGDLKKEGPFYDLPIALGVLNGLGVLDCEKRYEDYLCVGELALSGETRPIYGALAIAMLARKLKKKGVLLPAANAPEAAAVPDIAIIPIRSLKEAVQFLKDPSSIEPLAPHATKPLFRNSDASVDFSDIKGQAQAKRAMEIAAAGSHNVVLSGPPGSGKSMLAKALIGIMPKLTLEEALEVTRIHSVAGKLADGQSLVTQRPFCSPHHTVSYAGLIGGGSNPRPGVVSLAHHGILFLDELPEFSRHVLEVLRQPLEDRLVTISRAQGSITFPTNVLCVAAMNPCPCGHLGNPERPCTDTQVQVERYRSKISGPLWDRLDMHIDVPAVPYAEIARSDLGEPSSTVRERVVAARMKQRERFGRAMTNAEMSAKDIRRHCILDKESMEILKQSVELMGLSARACDRILKVARTIADLEGSDNVGQDHIMEAVTYRKK